MAYVKQTVIDHQTVIGAQLLNGMQDAIAYNAQEVDELRRMVAGQKDYAALTMGQPATGCIAIKNNQGTMVAWNANPDASWCSYYELSLGPGEYFVTGGYSAGVYAFVVAAEDNTAVSCFPPTLPESKDTVLVSRQRVVLDARQKLYVNHYRTVNDIAVEVYDVSPVYTGGSNVLYGKEWAVCGDSFTSGSRYDEVEDVLQSGRYQGQNKVYSYLIGSRNNMRIQDLSRGGRTLALRSDGVNTDNAFAGGLYQAIDEDADYITLYFGINDSNDSPSAPIPLGSPEDSTPCTFCGAWNVVLGWLVMNRPHAHIGILVSNAMTSWRWAEATVAMARRWGIPYLNMNGDDRTPVTIHSRNPAICEQARQLRTQSWMLSSDGFHPSSALHEYESTFIEAFLRTL